MDLQKISFRKIRQVVARIPKGKVVTYGDVANFLGSRDARKVGWALYGNRNPNIPCHRVVKKGGYLAERFSLGGWEEQRERLLQEGITFLGPRQVDIKKHRWKIA